ncbi:MAG TPA: hypothetical protein VF099_01535 [Ktedonobacterales bacterium]
MLSPKPHPDEIPVGHSLPETQPTRERRWLPLWREQQESAGARAWEWGLWPVLGGILLLVGVIAFFRFLAAAQVAGGCCGGGLVMLAGLIFLVIGLRDRGDFSR